MKRKIKVLKQPETFILVDSDKSDQEIIANWLLKCGKVKVSAASKNLERALIKKSKGMFKTY